MRKLVLLLLLTSCLVPGVATASDFPVIDNQVETRQAHLRWLLTIQEVSMEAVVDYIVEISEGNGTAQLVQHLNEYIVGLDDIDSYTTHIGLNNFLKDLKDITGDFRSESRRLINEHNGKVLTLLVRINDRISENEDKIGELKDQYWGTRKANVLENFDTRVERAQGVLDILEEREYEVTEAQAKLDEVIALRDDLAATLDAGDNLEIIRVSRDALELSRDLAEIVRSLQVRVSASRRLTRLVNVGERVVERTDVIIGELKSLELDISELEEINAKAEVHLADAKAKLEEGDYEGTADALRSLKDDMLELRDAYVDLVFPEGMPESIGAAFEALGEKLAETAGKMEEILDTL